MFKIILCLTAFVVPGLSQQQTRIACSSVQDCDFIENSICSAAGVCACGPGTQSTHGFTRCAPAAPYYGSPCVENVQCSRLMVGYECGSEGTCTCQTGFRFFNARCRATGDFGTACATDDQCIGDGDPFSLACVTGACACAPGYYERQFGECRRITDAPGGFCFLQSDCQFENAACDVPSLTCITLASADNVQTVSPSALAVEVPSVEKAAEKAAQETIEVHETGTMARLHGATCTTNAECATGLECSAQSHCICQIGAFPSDDGSTCLQELGQTPVGDECVHMFSEIDPSSGLCRCYNNFLYHPGMTGCLRPNTDFHLFCLSDLSCRTFGNAAICKVTNDLFGLTECDCVPEISARDEDNFVCRLVGVMGDVCEVDQECPNNAICAATGAADERTCACPPDTTPLPADQLCLNNNLELNEDCFLDMECGVADSACINGACSCKEGLSDNEGVCLPDLGGPCSVSEDCPMQYSECAQSVCTCLNISVQVDGDCFLHADGLEAECSYDAQCQQSIGAGAACLDETCQCGEDYHFRNDLCRQSVAVGSRCTTTGECFLLSDLERSVCRNQNCVCDWGYRYDPETRTCVDLSLSSSTTFGVGFTVLFIPATVIFFSRIIH